MPKPAASLASLLPQLWHRPFSPPRRLPRALSSSSSSLLTTRHIPRSRFRSSPTTHLGAAATAVTTAADSLEAPTANLYPLYDRLLPCPSQDFPPRIEHLVARKDEVAGDFISRSLSLPPLYVADLIKFGAVYYALVAPQPPPYAAPEHVRIFREVTEPSLLRRRASIKGKTVREAQKTFRVTDPSQHLEAGTYLRVHVHPKRFPRNYEIDWKSRLVATTDSYVVLNKPAATAVGGSTDNIEESCVVFTSRALGLESPLMTTHQIDNCSEGCVVLSKTKEFCSVFHGLIRERQVKKLYLALRDTNQRFVWALRDADRADMREPGGERWLAASAASLLGDAAAQGTGVVVTGWAPQLEILAHGATAAFMSHCGWNSTVEGLSHGKAILAWPMHSDQPWDAELVCKYLRAGILVRPWEERGDVTPAAAIREAIERAMRSDEGAAVRETARALGDAVCAARGNGGSSSRDMDDLVAYVTR